MVPAGMPALGLGKAGSLCHLPLEDPFLHPSPPFSGFCQGASSHSCPRAFACDHPCCTDLSLSMTLFSICLPRVSPWHQPQYNQQRTSSPVLTSVWADAGILFPGGLLGVGVECL